MFAEREGKRYSLFRSVAFGVVEILSDSQGKTILAFGITLRKSQQKIKETVS